MSNCFRYIPFAASIAKMAQIDSYQIIGEYISMKSTPGFRVKPFATKQALCLSISLFNLYFTL